MTGPFPSECGETLIEIEVCPECFGTGFANHYLTHNDRECWKCSGMGEIAVDTKMVRDDPTSPCPCVKPHVLCPDCQVWGGVNR